MAVCSFAGHTEVYDADLASRVQAEVDRLAKEYEAVEFLVYPAGMSSYIFLLAVLRARTRYPQRITITLVSYCGSVSKLNERELACLYMSDKVITLDMEDTKKNDPSIGRKRRQKWLVQNSTHLMSYFYDTIYDPDNQLGKVPKTLTLIRLTTHETEAAILKAAPLMTKKEQNIFYKLHEGCTMKEAGETVGVGRERARQILYHGCKTIRSELRQRYNQMIEEWKLRPCTCSLFALGESSWESMTRFKYVMEFLASTYIATDIYMERSYIFSGFLFVLKNMRISMLHRNSDTEIHITTLISKSSLPEEYDDIDAMRALYCPPSHAVGYVSRADTEDDADDFSVIADMIERTDFCICNLSATPCRERIQEYAAQTEGAVLLDIGRPWTSYIG